MSYDHAEYARVLGLLGGAGVTIETVYEYAYPKYPGWMLRVLPHLGEIHMSRSKTFDRWANSRQYSCRFPKDSAEATRLVQFLDNGPHIESDGVDELCVNYAMSKRFHAKRNHTPAEDNRSRKTRRRGS